MSVTEINVSIDLLNLILCQCVCWSLWRCDSLGVSQWFLVFWKLFHLRTLSYSWWFPSRCLVTDVIRDETHGCRSRQSSLNTTSTQGIVGEAERLRPHERQDNCSFESRTAVCKEGHSPSLHHIHSARNKSPSPPFAWNINDFIIQFALVSHIKWS